MVTKSNAKFTEVITALRFRKWRYLITLLIIQGLITVFVAIQPNTFSSYSILYPYVSDDLDLSSSSLGQLIGIGGKIPFLGGGGDEISPDLYKEVIKSEDFFFFLCEQQVWTSDSVEVSFEHYLQDIEEPGLIDRITTFLFAKKDTFPELRQEKYYYLNESSKDLQEYLMESVMVDFDLTSGLLSIHTTTQDRLVSSQINALTVDYLFDFTNAFHSKKLGEEMGLLTTSLERLEEDYDVSRRELARFVDSNRNLSKNHAEIELEHLELMRDLNFALYQQVRSRYEELKFRVSESRPVFQVVSRSSIASEKSGPKRIVMSITGLALNVVLIVLFIYLRIYISKWA